jgi:hypothetical protein
MKKWLPLLIAALAAVPSDAGWKKTVTKGGKTTVTGDAETMAQVERDEKAKAAYQKDIAQAPRRAPSDPIRVVLLNPIWEGKDRNENLERANKMLLDEFKGDPVLQVTMADIPRKAGESGAAETLIREAGNKRKSGDVYLHTYLGTEAALGRTKDGKVGVGNALVYKADVYSAYEPGSKQVKELGNLLQTAQMIKGVAKKSGDIIRNDIGPRLPSPAAVDDINKKHLQTALGIQPGDDNKAVLMKLFKPKKK